MRRFIPLLLCLALLFSLCACSRQNTIRINPITFYYKNAELRFNDGADVFYGLDVDLENPEIPISEIVDLYLEGPDEPFLESPFPPNAHLVDFTWEKDLLTLVLSNEFGSLKGLDRSFAMACLTLTLTQVNGVDAVLVQTVDGSFSYLNQMPLTAEDFVLNDLGGTAGETTVNLYFADENGSLLLLDTRSISVMELSEEAEYVVNQLLAGPEKTDLRDVFPKGVQLRSIQISGGVCTVDFTFDFLEHIPESAAEERLMIYALVNSLTELDPITAVRITVDGQRVGYYRYLNLAEPLERDETAIGPVRTGLNEFQATFYGSSVRTESLVGQKLRLRRPASQTMAEVTLSALLQWTPTSGLTNPIPSGTKALSVKERDGVCYVDLSKEFLAVQGNELAERAAVHSIICTLSRLPTIRRVSITVEGSSDVLNYVDLSQPIFAQPRWCVN